MVVYLLVFQLFWNYWKKYDTSPMLIVFILEYYSSFQRKASFLGNIVFLIFKIVYWLYLIPIYMSQGWVAVCIQMYYSFIPSVQVVQHYCTEWMCLNSWIVILYFPLNIHSHFPGPFNQKFENSEQSRWAEEVFLATWFSIHEFLYTTKPFSVFAPR